MKICLINESEIKMFSDKQKLIEFVNNISKPKEKLRGIKQKENDLSWK